MKLLLSVRHLEVRFSTPDGPVFPVNDVDLDVAEHEIVGLVGESGSGKTVTTLAILGLLPRGSSTITKGSISLRGREITGMADRELRSLRGKEVAFIFQDPMTSLNPVLRIGEQVIEAIQAHETLRKRAAKERATALLADVGIPDPDRVLSSYPHQLSGGMRQRVMIAIAIALKPRLLIADEPTTALDVTIQAQVLELIRDLTAKTGASAILISHDLGVVAGMTNRVYVMYGGTIVESGETQSVFDDPAHPYTVGLLHSIPSRAAASGSRLVPIDGVPPDMRTTVIGCPFAPRCRWRIPVCWTARPELRSVAAGATGDGKQPAGSAHLVACHNPPTPEEAEIGTPLREFGADGAVEAGPSASSAPTTGEAAGR